MAIDNSTSNIALEGLVKRRRIPMWLQPLHTLVTRKYLGTFGATVLIAMILAAVLADVIAPYDPVAQHLPDKLKAPSAQYILGTDQFGRDLLSRLIYGARTSLYVGIGVVLLGTGAATILGIISGYFGGKLDIIFQRFVDAVQSIPSLVLLLTIVAVIGPGILNIIMALAFRQSISESRIVRSAVLGIKENQYMDAARAVGASSPRILLFYVFPNVTAPIIVLASLTLGQAILAEATLSFLGFGVPPPHATWGSLLSDEGRRFMIAAPWMAIFPGLALSLAVFGINMFGDGLRDVLDPRLRGSR